MAPRRIGILMTNTDESAFAGRHPKDGEKFTRLLGSVRPGWEVAVYPVKDGVLPSRIEECDGYVITGSPASVNGSADWIARLLELIRELDAARTPTVGCCFGHQAIALALGGKVERSVRGWGLGVLPTHFSVREAWMEPFSPTLHLYAAHNEQVTELPAGAVVLGGSDFCPVGSFRVGEHFFTTELHPEMTAEFFSALADDIADHVGRDVAARAKAEATARPADGGVFAEWMARFLEMRR